MKHSCRVLLIAICVSAGTHSSAIAQDKPFFERLGEGVARLLNGEAIPQLEPGGVGMRADLVVDDGLEAEKQQKDRLEKEERLRGHLQATAAWIDGCCSLDVPQKEAVNKLIVEVLNAKLEEKEGPGQRQQAFSSNMPATAPILFAGFSGTGRRAEIAFLERIRAEVLNEKQKSTLSDAFTERQLSISSGYRQYLILLLDEELLLTSEQAAAFSKELSAKEVRHPLYAFRPMPYFLPYESIREVVTAEMGQVFLDSVQRDRLNDLLATEPNSNVMTIDSSLSVEDVEKQISDNSQILREKYLRSAAVRIGWYQKVIGLDAQQRKTLETAAKGAATDSVAEWRDSSSLSVENILQNMEQFGGNVSMGLADVSMDPNANAIWKAALGRVLPDADTHPALAGRRGEAKKVIAGMLTALLDEELWLNQQQRTSLQELVTAILPDSYAKQSWEYFRELILLAYPLTKISDGARSEVLNVHQQMVWSQLAGCYKVRREAGPGAVEFVLQNQGNWIFILTE